MSPEKDDPGRRSFWPGLIVTLLMFNHFIDSVPYLLLSTTGQEKIQCAHHHYKYWNE
jgi:hypothetical protein